jgi:hypothetical protein
MSMANGKRKPADGTTPECARVSLRTFAVLHFSFVILLLGGCEAAAVAIYKIHGPPAVKAQYTPVKTDPMLVMVENYQRQASTEPHAAMLAQFLVRDLGTQQIAPLVPLETLQRVRDEKGQAEFSKMSIAAIGRETGAKQILYVELKSSDVTPLSGGEALSGNSMAAVRVIDVASGKTLWPEGMEGSGASGYPVAASAKIGAPPSEAAPNPQVVRQRMNAQLSDQIVKLFYKWKPDELEQPESITE